MTRLANKAIVVTGSGRGIGAATAEHLAALGARVVINDVDPGPAEDTAAAIVAQGGVAIAHAADITDWDAAGALIERCRSEFGAINGLVNNAGLFSMGRIDELKKGDSDRILAVNVTGTINCAAHAAKAMLVQGEGVIINITSSAQMGIPAMGLYGATKGAVAALTYAWALELAETGVRVNAVSPMANTRMVGTTAAYHRSHDVENASMAQASPATNAPIIAYLLSDAARSVRGQVVRVDGERLSLVSHPAVILPALHHEGGWTADAVEEAFRGILAPHITPVGFTGINVAGYGMPDSIWSNPEPVGADT